MNIRRKSHEHLIKEVSSPQRPSFFRALKTVKMKGVVVETDKGSRFLSPSHEKSGKSCEGTLAITLLKKSMQRKREEHKKASLERGNKNIHSRVKSDLSIIFQ
jgi:hypothetical protein